MAIQDGQALDEALQSAKGDINAALERFNNVRHKQVKDCQKLEKVRVSRKRLLCEKCSFTVCLRINW